MPNTVEPYDFSAFGKAIKAARNKRGWTRDQVVGMLNFDVRHLTGIENEGDYPSVQLLHKLVSLLDLSVDEFFFPDAKPDKSSCRRHVESVLDGLDDDDMQVVEATATALAKAKEAREAK